MKRALCIGFTILVSGLVAGCGSDDEPGGGSGGASGTGGSGGTGASGGAGGETGGSGGTAGNSGSAGSGGTAGSGGSAGVAGGAGAGGGGAKTCEMLDADYAAAVVAAKKCVYGTSPNPCTTKLKKGLECQCPTFVNPANAAALAEMSTIEAVWTAKGCVSVACPCANPSAGACYAGPGGPSDGSCADG